MFSSFAMMLCFSYLLSLGDCAVRFFPLFSAVTLLKSWSVRRAVGRKVFHDVLIAWCCWSGPAQSLGGDLHAVPSLYFHHYAAQGSPQENLFVVQVDQILERSPSPGKRSVSVSMLWVIVQTQSSLSLLESPEVSAA